MNLDSEFLVLKERVTSLEITESTLRQRVEKLEVQLAGPSAMPSSKETPPPPNPGSPAMSQPYRSSVPAQLPPPLPANRVAYPQPLSKPQHTTNSAVAVSSETLLRWAGLVLVSLAAIFFVSTAINRGWIGPELQLAGATAVGIGLHGMAIRLESRARNWAYTLAHGATVVLAWSAAASYQWLGVFSIEAGLALLALAALVSTAVAVKFRFSTVALSAGLTGALMPLWMDIFGSTTLTVASLWYCIVGVAYACLGLWQRWPEVRIAVSWVCTGLLSLGFVFDPAFDGAQAKVPGLAALTGLIAALWVGPWVQAKVANSGEYKAQRDDFDHVVKALDHRSTLALPGVYLAASAVLLSTGSSAGIGRLGLMVAAGFATILVVAMVVAPPGILFASNVSTRRWSMPNGLAVSHLFGIGTVLVVSAVDLLDGPTLLIAIALQALGTAAVAAYFRDVVLGAKAIVLISVSTLVSMAWMIDATIDDSQLDVGQTLANLVVVVTLVGFALTARYLSTQVEGWQWWSRRRPVVELADGVAWTVGLLWIGSVVTVLIDFSLNPGLLALFGGLSVIAYRFLGRSVLLTGIVLSAIGIAAAALGIFFAYFEEIDVVAHGNHLFVVLCLVAVAAWAWTRPDTYGVSSIEGDTEAADQLADSQNRGSYGILAEAHNRATLFVLAWVAGLGWLGSILISGPQGQVAVSAVWAVAGCLALLAGIRFNQQSVRLTGLATLGVVVAKLLTVDLAEVETLWRVGLFFLLGLGFMRLGYVLPKLAKRYAADDQPIATPEEPQGGPSEPVAVGPQSQH